MSKIPTAEEYFAKRYKELGISHSDEIEDEDQKIAIEFARRHVKAALEAAADNAKVEMIENCHDHTPYWGACGSCGRYDNPDIATENVDRDSILNAYPLDKIK